jgi:Cft2 family RNA processing exonuclease
MTPTLSFFPVGNGDMALLRLFDDTTILIDCNIRKAADDPADKNTRDVAKDLRARLPRDSKGRPYVDAFLLSHPDKDHCSGVRTRSIMSFMKKRRHGPRRHVAGSNTIGTTAGPEKVIAS